MIAGASYLQNRAAVLLTNGGLRIFGAYVDAIHVSGIPDDDRCFRFLDEVWRSAEIAQTLRRDRRVIPVHLYMREDAGPVGLGRVKAWARARGHRAAEWMRAVQETERVKVEPHDVEVWMKSGSVEQASAAEKVGSAKNSFVVNFMYLYSRL